MTNLKIYEDFCASSSKEVTRRYSTSFAWASRLFAPEIRRHIYSIYGFVRLADEIVDTFHGYDREKIFREFERNYQDGLANGISLNPILHSFCSTQREKGIPQELVDAFLDSMKMDLSEIDGLSDADYRAYIYGSAEAVGLMCLTLFMNGDRGRYEQLKPYAQSLGAAFQKINFLRDFSADFTQLNRTYFPNVDFKKFTQQDKDLIEADITQDFKHALVGIKLLPASSRLAVFMAYKYYFNLFRKIRDTPPQRLVSKRIRLSNARKAWLFGQMMISKKLSLS